MEKPLLSHQISWFGGPLHALGLRLGLVRGSNTLALGFAIGLSLWLVMMALALIEGIASQVLSLSLISGHVRMLIVIPMFFFCETVFAPRCTDFLHSLIRGDIIPDDERASLDTIIARLQQWHTSWLPEVICLVGAVWLSLNASQLHLFGVSAIRSADGTQGTWLAIEWYFMVCLPLFRFLVLRWCWRLGLWWYCLWRLSRLRLRLVPTHPDGAAGLGYLAVTQTHFLPLVVATSILQCASFAEEISVGKMPFDAVYSALVVNLLINAVLVLTPLFFFSAKLWACRVKGISDYMDLASAYVEAFDRKWFRRDANGDMPIPLSATPIRSTVNREAAGETLLGTADLQSLADLSNSVQVVRDMVWVPIGRRLLLGLVGTVLVPALPLLLFQYPATTLAQKIMTALFGL